MHIKKSKWVYFVGIISLSLLMLTMLFPPIVQVTSAQAASASDAYDYPVKPGTAGWKAFTTHDEMLKACQIPEDILKNMSTKGLVETVLEYPLYGDMMAYDSIQQGFEAVASQFNGLSELLNRKDAGTELLAIYSKMNPLDIKENWGDIQKGAYGFSIASVEILLAQNKILDNLNEIQLGDLLIEARSKYTAKQQSAIYGQLSLDNTQQLIERGSQRHYTSRQYNSYVYTPKGTAVAVIVDRPEMSAAEIAYWNSWVRSNYPFATIVAPATNKYNCHSYAWYSQSYSTNNKWMNDPSAYWKDGSYKRWVAPGVAGSWTGPITPPANAKMHWESADHSGIYSYSMAGHMPNGQLFTVVYCISKWGSLPLMAHQATYCPYTSTKIAFYYR
jgi:hypothetical protein